MEFEISSKKLKMVVQVQVQDTHPPKLINDGGTSSLPIAPTPERNNEQPLLTSDSPLTWLIDSDLHNEEHITADPESSPRTPKAHIFNSFSPSTADNLGFELVPPPIKKKPKVNVARRLNFDNSVTPVGYTLVQGSLVKKRVVRRLNFDDSSIRVKDVKTSSSSSSTPSSVGQVRQRPVSNKPPNPQKRTKASSFR